MSLKVTITDYSGAKETTTDVVLDGDQASCDDAQFFGFLQENGAIGQGGKAFFPKDGRAFMDALQFQFSGSFVRASEPVEM